MTRNDVMTSRRAAGAIKRYHAWPTLQTQTVAEHSWRVAMIHSELFDNPKWEDEGYICQYILEHDLAELHTGDVPFHIKNKYPEIRTVMKLAEHDGDEALKLNDIKLSMWELGRIKICDVLEMFEFGLVERAMGSKFAEPIITGTRWRATELAEELDLSETVRKWCDKEEARYA